MSTSQGRVCDGKIGYPDKERAAAAAKIMVSRGAAKVGRGRKFVPYVCPMCALYHVGHIARSRVNGHKRRYGGTR